jgi:hypothetical protein
MSSFASSKASFATAFARLKILASANYHVIKEEKATYAGLMQIQPEMRRELATHLTFEPLELLVSLEAHDAGDAFERVLPVFFESHPDGRDYAHASDDHSIH